MIRNIEHYNVNFYTAQLISNYKMSTGIKKLWWKFRVMLNHLNQEN